MSRLDTSRNRVAVLGLGVSGLTAVKNLLEQGFEVTAFEKNEYIGGIWQYNPDPKETSALKKTPQYPTADQLCEYMRSYASHFSLEKHFRLGMTIDKVELVHPHATSEPVKWLLKMHDKGGKEMQETFDRVLVTTGPYSQYFIPKIPGMDVFGGDVMHSQAYKDAESFVGKRVVVVGLGNTGGDIAVDLVGSAKKVYLSHRAGALVVKRWVKGKPLDSMATRRLTTPSSLLHLLLPSLAAFIMKVIFDRLRETMFFKANPNYRKEWKLIPAPPAANVPVVMNDELVNRFADGEITNLSGITRFMESGIVTEDQGEIEVDAVIFATGSYFDYSILSEEADPTNQHSAEWEKSSYRNDLRFPRLYQTFFSTRYPDSLAFNGPCKGFSFSAFPNHDLAAQAIARVWRGSFPLPDKDEMERWCDRNLDQNLKLVKAWRISKTGTDNAELEKWLHDAAGTDVNEALGWGWAGWKFWWEERELYKLIMGGMSTPFVYRLFEGKEGSRKRWDGAREAIYKANGLTTR